MTLPSTVFFAEFSVETGVTQALVQEVRDRAEYFNHISLFPANCFINDEKFMKLHIYTKRLRNGKKLKILLQEEKLQISAKRDKGVSPTHPPTHHLIRSWLPFDKTRELRRFNVVPQWVQMRIRIQLTKIMRIRFSNPDP
jgi:hypothetical protein